MKAIGYSFEEALQSLRRAGRSTLFSVGTIAIAFVALGGFLLVSVNVQEVIDRWLVSAEISVYLADTITEEEQAGLQEDLKRNPAVVAVEYISKERALQRFQADFPELKDVASTLDENPFPAVFEIRLRPGQNVSDQAAELAATMMGRAGVADVRYDRQWLIRLLALVTGGRIAAAIVAVVLMLGAAFTVAAVVRLSIFARRDELEIMTLVGAPFSFIRGPSVVEGTMLGGFGAVLALAVVWVLYTVVSQNLGSNLAGLFDTGQVRFLGWLESLLLLVGGLLVGGLAGVWASRSVR